MTRARVELVSLADTPWYHIVNRCVRRAFLCGVDSLTGQNFEHRRAWIEQRVMQLASVFAIDVASFAIMSNHYHLVLRVNEDRARAWSDLQVLQQWTLLFSGSRVLQEYLRAPHEASEAVAVSMKALAAVYRVRLFDISWMMRVLNESIARMANKEDEVTGRFWEGRFKSQALLDDKAVLSVMAYVDLNPVRANIAQDLVSSEFTSIKRRIEGTEGFCHALLEVPERMPDRRGVEPVADVEFGFKEKSISVFLARLNALPMAALMPMDGTGLQADGVPFGHEDYLEFVGYLGQAVHPKKRGFLASVAPKLMTDFALSMAYVKAACVGGLSKKFGKVIGAPESLAAFSASHELRYAKGSALAKEIFA